MHSMRYVNEESYFRRSRGATNLNDILSFISLSQSAFKCSDLNKIFEPDERC